MCFNPFPIHLASECNNHNMKPTHKIVGVKKDSPKQIKKVAKSMGSKEVKIVNVGGEYHVQNKHGITAPAHRFVLDKIDLPSHIDTLKSVLSRYGSKRIDDFLRLVELNTSPEVINKFGFINVQNFDEHVVEFIFPRVRMQFVNGHLQSMDVTDDTILLESYIFETSTVIILAARLCFF